MSVLFPGRKYLLRKAFESASQVVNELGSSFCSQPLTLSFSEKGKILSCIASVDTPLNLMMPLFARNLRKCILGLFEGYPPNWSLSTKVTRAWLSSKLLASTAGLTMDEVMPNTCGRT